MKKNLVMKCLSCLIMHHSSYTHYMMACNTFLQMHALCHNFATAGNENRLGCSQTIFPLCGENGTGNKTRGKLSAVHAF